MSSGMSGLGGSGLGSGLGGPGFTGGSGMSGAMGGTGFSGGMSGGSGFTGSSTGGFSGVSGTGFSGGNIRAGTTYGSTALWGPYLSSPYAMGLQGGARQIQHPFTSETLRFGTPLYTNTTTGTASMGGGAGMGMTNRGGYGTSIGIRRAPAYTVALGSEVAPSTAAGPLQVRADLQDVLARSSRLNARDTIQVGMVGPVVVLRGTVLDEHDRRLAENLIRLSPGVHEIRNELVVPGATASTSALRP
jgi:hypothetical protein